MLEELLPTNPSFPLEYTDEKDTTFVFNSDDNSYVTINRTTISGTVYHDATSYNYFMHMINDWNKDIIIRNAELVARSITKQYPIRNFRCIVCNCTNTSSRSNLTLEEQNHFDKCPYVQAMLLQQQIRELNDAN